MSSSLNLVAKDQLQYGDIFLDNSGQVSTCIDRDIHPGHVSSRLPHGSTPLWPDGELIFVFETFDQMVDFVHGGMNLESLCAPAR